MPTPYKDIIKLAQTAGEAIMAIYQRDFGIEQKEDKSPLTEADKASHNTIVEGLQKLTPQTPILSEESTATDWAERQHWTTYWLIDPLDGTKEFIKKNGEFTVNIALIENGQPTWGVVDAPALGCTYHGGPATGQSQKYDYETGKETTLRVSKPPQGSTGWRIVGSRSHQSEDFKNFIQRYTDPQIKSMGSSLKICLVAEGEADIYPRLGPTSEWDTAAAHAVLLGAGGKIVEAETGQPLLYNQKESVLNPFFIAAPEGCEV